MSTDNIFIKEVSNRLSIILIKCVNFNPFGEVIDSDDYVAFSRFGDGQWSHDIHSYLVKGFREFLDWLERCFTPFSFAFLADLTGFDKVDDVILHSRPIVDFCSFLNVAS